ncbi:MAG TPA: TIGR02206 family membrane protein [Bacillales bacterium]|nr:TIGR02206 family membrane protein [Bacillales bacterium]
MDLWIYNPDNDFHMFGMAHIFTLVAIVLLVLGFYWFRGQLRPYRRKIRMITGCALIITRLSLDFWYVATGNWEATHSLPLELCGIATIACGIMLLTRNRHLFEIFYFIALGGAAQAILTPNLVFGFPQYRYIEFFLAHFLIFVSPLILCWLYDYVITRRALFKALVALHAIAFVVFFIDLGLGANYMFLRHKPGTPSLLDLLGPYPWYFISLEAVVLVIFGLLYLPFAGKRRDSESVRTHSEG